MARRTSSRTVGLGLIAAVGLSSTMLAITTNLLTSNDQKIKAVGVIGDWSVPLAIAMLVVFIGASVTLYLLDHPPARRPLWDAERSPYLGLEAYGPDDQVVFCGRDAEIRRLDLHVSGGDPAAAGRVTVVTGPSGSGKSSLVRAGLIPRLQQTRRRWKVLPPMIPGKQPIANLCRCLAEALSGAASAGAHQEFTVAEAERLLAEAAGAAGAAGATLIVVDQAEELYILSGEQERDDLFAILGRAIRDHSRMRLVLIVRSDFLTPFLASPHAALFRDVVPIAVPNSEALLEIINEPAHRAGLEFEPGLVARIVADTVHGDALPLLSYTMHQLYNHRDGQRLTLEAYRKLGGVAGAISEQANAAAARAGTGSVEPVLRVLLKFVNLDGEATRRSVSAATLTGPEAQVTAEFITARLMSTDRVGDDVTISVTHEALFRQWEPLTTAIAEHGDDLARRAELERWSQDWERGGRDESFLLRGDRLRGALEWMADSHGIGDGLPRVDDFLNASRRADRDASLALADIVATRALAVKQDDPELGLLYAMAAVQECRPSRFAYRALLTVLGEPIIRVLRGHRDAVQGVAWSPDGGRIVSAADDRTARIWDAEDGTELGVLSGHADAVWDVGWSSDGEKVVTASRDRTARIWDARNGAVLAELRGHREWVGRVRFSPDDSWIVTTSLDRSARLWTGSGAYVAELTGHDDAIWGVAWSPDSHRLATASNDRTVRIWDIERRTVLEVLRGHRDAVWGVAWAPDGNRLATCSRDRTARIWDLRQRTEQLQLCGHADVVRDVAWSPDGRRLATASHDRTTRIWDTAQGADLITLHGHDGPVRGTAWSRDGKRIVTASHDRTIRLWDTERGFELAALRGHQDWVNAVAWTPDGTMLATASHDRTCRVWDPTTGAETLCLSGHREVVRDVSWSPDGARMATASHDRTIRIWDAADGHTIAVLTGHDDAVCAVRWSPDGLSLASASHDGTVRIWDLQETARPVTLERHPGVWAAAVAWAPSGTRLLTGSYDGTATVWDVTEHMPALRIVGHDGPLGAVAWAPDGELLATASDDATVRLWRAGDGALSAVLRGHEDAVWDVAWSATRPNVVTASRDRTTRVWDISGAEVALLCVQDDAVGGVAWAPDGTRIATASRDRTARIWNAKDTASAPLAKAANRVMRTLTPAERHSVMLAAPSVRPSAGGPGAGS